MKPASEPLPAAKQDPAEQSARSIECAQKADAPGLQGKTRKTLLARVQAKPMSAALRRPPLSEATVDERVETFLTPRDWLRYAVGRFLSAGLAFGHGATTALDEAAFLILEGLGLPIDTLDPFLDARLLRHERARLCELIEARVTTRKPAAYLVNRAYIKGVPFYVDERVIVPRSLIGELVMTAFAEDNALIGDPERIASVLDLCTGGGSLAILAARVFPNARIEAVDVSPGALEVAARNLEEHGLQDRIALKQGDLFAPVEGARFDLILTNPPYVDAATIAGLSARICGRADARACRRSGRARHRAPHPERSAQAS